jgi:hypothetical protein
VTPLEGRQAILDAALPALPEAWTGYVMPPEQLSLPAAVIVPRSPYGRQSTFCAEIMGVELRLVMGRTVGTQGLEELDVLSALVRDALIPLVSLAYESRDLGRLDQWGGVETLDARLLLELYL